METDIPTHNHHKGPKTGWESITLKIIGVVLILGATFYGGVAYQKSHTKTVALINTPASTSSGNGAFGGRGSGSYTNANRPVFGVISSVSGTVFTVADQRTGSTTTVQTSTSTTYSGGTASSLAAGITVIVRGTANSSGVIQATAITINPNLGGNNSSGTTENSYSTPVPGTNSD